MRGLKHEESPPAFLTSVFSPPSHLSHTFISLFALPKLPSTAFTYIMGKQIRVRETVNEALPPLLKTDFHTNANAVHRLIYNGELNYWPNFCQDVRATMDNQHWSNRVIGYTLNTHDLDDNKVFVGDETGVQGRFQQAIGQRLGKVFEAQRLDIQFADFKCLPNLGNKVPDCVMKTSRNELKLVGELKVPWVIHHRIKDHLELRPFRQKSYFRVLVGQVLRYMKELGCMYGFLSNYEETIFLRQRHNGTTWVVDCSPVILASNVYTKGSPTVTVRECFFYIAILARQQGKVDNQLPPKSWVESI
ncbi:hypothetical protein PEX2_010570 [Penicillium expansum]|uniref:Uncharacterized protein n=1 Tax=Penicillium expansum TaxID=27334 RepID=A0A0A2J9P4_PENEN|nr:hypothetical protein PEX2_010570 [Penicillium expansum]KGO51516.1 hypothetical protein PEX2_010570 [Penicillium expansum]